LKIKDLLFRHAPGNAPFLRNTFYFFVTAAVLLTTVCGWFRINTWCIVLLGLCRLTEGNVAANVRKAFSNTFFLAYFALFLLDLISQLFTPDLAEGWKIVSRDATLVAIPFVISGGVFADEDSYKKLMALYCVMLALASIACLLHAGRSWLSSGDGDVFFYHPLVSPISQNAVFFSVFILFGLFFLLSYDLRPVYPGFPGRLVRLLRFFLVFLFIIMIILLASKLFLVIMLLALAWFQLRRYRFTGNRVLLISAGTGLALLITLLLATDNPIKARYKDVLEANDSKISKEHFAPGDSFNGIQIRLLEWRFAYEILNEHRAWIAGTTPGNSQHLLNQKYVGANMYLGQPGKKGRGFWDYNFHDLYVEALVRTGLIGLLILLAIFGLQIGIVWRWKTGQAFFTVLTLLLFFVPQSPLTMQTGVFLFSFFPFLLLYSPKAAS
jgi:O-antigen ligase